ncbi:hypothetical protein GN958_ATG00831 [Phytophthora infestans]|uniref:Uncharacterized protein n=1 Tax=Phytophthora infestans TaxID=4787 RepID=A0A8S9VEX5_PHYIN|nr:hypothetical protein GN958_ATG00831 [Phytophthora infestans]
MYQLDVDTNKDVRLDDISPSEKEGVITPDQRTMAWEGRLRTRRLRQTECACGSAAQKTSGRKVGRRNGFGTWKDSCHRKQQKVRETITSGRNGRLDLTR